MARRRRSSLDPEGSHVAGHRRLGPRTARADSEISQTVASTLERAAGYQSNPRIRKAIEGYAMKWALRRLKELGLNPVDTHATKPYDFVCKAGGADLFVEVKGTQEDGRRISLSLPTKLNTRSDLKIQPCSSCTA